MKRTRLKVCCIASIAEAELAIAHGADAIGLVGEMPSGPGTIDRERIREIAAWTPPPVETFLLSSGLTGDAIADDVESCGTTTVQIVQHIAVGEYQRIIERIPRVRRVQVVHVEDRSALGLIEIYEPYVHAFLLDSGRPNAAVAEFGGTGRAHDWNISASFVQQSSKPVFLAGGLKPANIKDAISRVDPFGVDLCSGVRRSGKLNAQLIDNFSKNLWG